MRNASHTPLYRTLYVRKNLLGKNLSWLQNKWALRNQYFKFKDPDGFVRGSLYNRFSVNEKNLPALYKRGFTAGHYDYLVINYKSDSSATGERFTDEFSLPKGADHIPIILYVGNARTSVMPSDSVLDQFDLILKRQPYRDLDRYDISTRNREKIRPTTLACPIVRANKSNIHSIRPADYGFSEPSLDCSVDVFFSGQANNPIRTQAWTHLIDSGLSTSGGLQKDDTHGIYPPPELAAPKIRKPQYTQAMRDASVNLALDGLGEFSYRHMEAWCLACMAMCSPTTRELALPFPAVEGEHFVCYENMDDLIEKVHHFSTADDERMRIATAGRDLFEKYFSFEYHGRQLQHWFDNAAQPFSLDV